MMTGGDISVRTWDDILMYVHMRPRPKFPMLHISLPITMKIFAHEINM